MINDLELLLRGDLGPQTLLAYCQKTHPGGFQVRGHEEEVVNSRVMFALCSVLRLHFHASSSFLADR